MTATPKMAELKAISSYWYLATPYSKFEAGHESAFRQASATAAFFVKLGIPVFSPIAHSHPIAVTGQIDKNDHAVWMAVDQPFMDAAGGLIVVMMPGWDESFGIGEEIKDFTAKGKPVLYMEYPPTFGTDAAKIVDYYEAQTTDYDLRTIFEWPEPKHFDSAFDTKAELDAKVAK